MTTVPRVAASIDDLRVGMVVVCQRRDGTWGNPVQVEPGGIREQLRQGHPVCPTVILSDPPPVPVRVPADLIDALEAAYDSWAATSDNDPVGMANAICAVVDAARNGTDQ